MTVSVLETEARSESKVILFFRMIKLEHSIFAMPFAYLGFFLSAEGGFFRWANFFWVTLAMVSFRTMAMGLNRLMDQKIDSLNPRTRRRELPSGKLSRPYVWGWTLSSLGLYFYSAYSLSLVCLALAPVPALLAALYPLMKRFTWGSHWILGAVLGMAPVGAWIANRGSLELAPLGFGAGVLCWAAGFDILYAVQDMTFDRARGLHSFPARFGFQASLVMTRLLHLMTVWMWAGAGIAAGLGSAYFIGLALVTAFLIREHFLVELYGSDKLEEAFFVMNAGVSSVILLSVLADLFIRRAFG